MSLNRTCKEGFCVFCMKRRPHWTSYFNA